MPISFLKSTANTSGKLVRPLGYQYPVGLNSTLSTTTVTFNSTPGPGSYTIPTNGTVTEALIVGGGGAGGRDNGGGGGAGALIYKTGLSLTGSQPVSVGAGGTSTVGTTANAVTMITISAIRVSGATQYLITVSPEFTG